MQATLSGKNVLVTGGAGFIGRRLVAALLDAGALVRVLIRKTRVGDVERLWPSKRVRPVTADLMDVASLEGVCSGVDTVFHLAGYAHAENAAGERSEEMHRRVTVEGARALLAETRRAKVERFVFTSTVKAMGEGGEAQLDEASPAAPASDYGRAKLEAEGLVFAAGEAAGMHASALRLPLVYGRDNRGNLPRMIAAVDRGRFPPLPEVHNKRSMVHVDDVVQALLLAAQTPKARGQVFLVTDGRVYSTRQIYESICAALGKKLPRWSVPLWFLRLAARVGDAIGGVRGRKFPFNSETLSKLIGSAWYSSEKIARELGYRPTRTLEDSIPEMVEEYRKTVRRETLSVKGE